MNYLPPLGRQIIVASAPILAAASVGGILGYVPVLINQLNMQGSDIVLDLSSTSWIASITGIMGIPSIFIPSLMQRRGRKIGFIIASVCIILGSILIFFAHSVKVIIIGECFQGLGLSSVIPVSLATISEMVDPKIRSMTMGLFSASRIMGIVFIMVMGYFINWRIISIILSIPIFLSLLLVMLWPESPPWLACRGQFEKCEVAFTLLRGTGVEARTELEALIKAQRECIQKKNLRSDQVSVLKKKLSQIRRRDFYFPMLHVFMLMFALYFSGGVAMLTYAPQMLAKLTREKDLSCLIYFGITMTLSAASSLFWVKYFHSKTVMIVSYLGVVVSHIGFSVLLYLRDAYVFSKWLSIFFLLIFFYFGGIGASALSYNVSTELIPVKHRGLGGALFIIFLSLSQALSQKVVPYLFLAIDEFGTVLLFATISFMSALFIWKCIPETKGRTLQEIEDYYNNGHFRNKSSLDEEPTVITPIVNSINITD